MERITSHTYLDLVKCMNILLENYNEVNVGGTSFRTSEIFGKQPHEYQNSNSDPLVSAEILNNNKMSVSPCKNRSIIATPSKLIKIKSTYGNKYKTDKKKKYQKNYEEKSPTGILRPKG